MKKNKLFSTLAICLISMLGFAQEKQTEVKNDLSVSEYSVEKRAESSLYELTKVVDMTAIQQQKIYELNLGIERKNDAIRRDASINDNQKAERIQANLNQQRKVIEQILDPEQVEKLPAVPQVRTKSSVSAPAQQAKPAKPSKPEPSKLR